MIWVIFALRSAGPSGPSVRHMTMKKSACLPFDVNHLCPLITHSSPSRRAVVLSERGSEPGWSGSVMEKPDSIRPSISGMSQRSFCSSVPYLTRIDSFPELGATTPNSDAAPARDRAATEPTHGGVPLPAVVEERGPSPLTMPTGR